MKSKALDETLYPHEWLLQSKFVFAMLGLAIGMIFMMVIVVGPMVFDVVPMEPTSGWCTSTSPTSDLFPFVKAFVLGVLFIFGIAAVFYFTYD